MLAIERAPLYKNRFVLSGMAVLAGFLVTVGIIRAANPIDTSTNQSAQSSSERRATSIVPIKSSESESSSESGKKTDSSTADTKTPVAVQGVQPDAGTTGTPWIAPAPASSASPQPAARTNTAAPSRSTTTQQQPTATSPQPSTSTTTQPAPSQSTPNSSTSSTPPKNCVDILGMPIVCI